MNEEPRLDCYLDSLRGDLPTASDDSRIRQRLSAAGIGVSAALVSQSAAATTAVLSKASLLSTLSAKFATLPLLAQMGLVTATTALLATGPVAVAVEYRQTVSAHNTEAPTTSVRPVDASNAVTKSAPPGTPQVNDVSTLPQRDESNDATKTRTEQSTRVSPQRSLRVPVSNDPSPSSLAAETKLLDSALAAIRDGRLDEAERLLLTHAEQFTAGRLSLERQRTERKLLEARKRTAP